ncbi:MAG: DegT/DnrJ/EryC1/StrS family aminotransferase [Candidatus Bathyarchaeia archaeon]|jgi:dTDP-4-amino-4,6-dideoxygalactose transaminase|nr:DegT/DnrJ/EryC1/StrS family aminotransferase [Candidatus Bathyarchaeota archaeon A05DMB-4]MDH7595375.1 DegT/DnrJ/EryC1/StrS family aminotransferase [Candidatus Bathyarchaeota archaeon]
MIPVNLPLVGDEEIKAVAEVLKSRVLTGRVQSGPWVKKFEEGFAEFVEAKYGFAVCSGTAALHLALMAAGVEAGDEVVVPSFSFIATAEVVALAGARPVFVDINSETFNVDPEKIEKALTKRTKAIIPVDLYGLPADLKPIREIADKHGLVIIEDAAQAHGAAYMGKPAGSFADLACWSFYASKNMTTGEGGMITTNSEEYASKIPYIRAHGEREEYFSSMLGHNYRMPEVEGAIGCVQLGKLPRFLAVRRRNALRLGERLRVAERLQLPFEPKGYVHSWYLFTVRLKDASVDERDGVVEKLRQKGVGATVYYRTPIHLMPYYKRFGVYHLPVAEVASRQVFSLPVHPGVSLEQVDFIADAVIELLG